jgi:hypothetical protein
MSEAAAVVAAASMQMDDNQLSEENFSATTALIAFLRMEADLSEEKAKRLRDQASALAQNFGVSESVQDAYGTSVVGNISQTFVRNTFDLARTVSLFHFYVWKRHTNSQTISSLSLFHYFLTDCIALLQN